MRGTPTKLALFIVVLRRLSERNFFEDLSREDGLSLRDGLRLRARTMMDRALTDYDLSVARLFMVELAHFPDLGKTIWTAVENQHGASMTEYFRSHQRRRNIRAARSRPAVGAVSVQHLFIHQPRRPAPARQADRCRSRRLYRQYGRCHGPRHRTLGSQHGEKLFSVASASISSKKIYVFNSNQSSIALL